MQTSTSTSAQQVVAHPCPAVIASLSSSRGEMGTNWAIAAMINLDDALRERIERAYATIVANRDFDKIVIDAQFLTLPGSDNCTDRGKASDKDEEAICELDESLDTEPRTATADERALFQRMDAFSVEGYAVVVTYYAAPYLTCHDRYDGESFESCHIPELMPPAMVEENQKRRANQA